MCGKSLMYTKNSNDPRTEPYGTPQLFSSNSDDFSLNETYCLRSLTYDLNQSSSLPLSHSVPVYSVICHDLLYQMLFSGPQKCHNQIFHHQWYLDTAMFSNRMLKLS